MSIKFLCPHCKKALNVKDEAAGKKGKCSHCGKLVTVPVPGKPARAAVQPTETPAAPPPQAVKAAAPPPPPADVEAEAAAALVDKPETDGAPPESSTIDFECPMCGAALHLPLDLADKRTPCPECRRIIKVPEPATKDPANWRQVNQSLPSAARRPEEPAPAGAWGSAAAATVSREALQDAGAIPSAKARLTVRQKIIRAAWVGAAAVLLLVVAVLGYLKWVETWKEKALDLALGYADTDQGKSDLGRDGLAAVYRLAGEYSLRAKGPESAAKARDYFEKSLSLLGPAFDGAGPAAERDALLQDLALAEVELGGSPEEADAGLKLKWDDVQKELASSLRDMRFNEARMEALREVARRLAAKGQGGRAPALASSLYPSPNEEKAEALGGVGLELLAAGKKDLAEKAAGQALEVYKAEKDRPALAPAAVALAVALSWEQPAKSKKPSKWAVEDDTNTHLGQAEGAARTGKWDDARRNAQDNGLTADAKLRAYVALAAASLDDKAAGAGVADEAAQRALNPPQGTPPSSWLLLRLARVAARAGVSQDSLQSLAAAVPDRDLRGRAQLAALEAQLAQTKQAADPKAADVVEPQTLSARLAHEAMARHNIHYSSGTPGVVKAWKDPDRAFGYLGVALGAQGDE